MCQVRCPLRKRTDFRKQTFTSDQEAYFQKVHNHLVAKYNNVRGRHYRQPIPTGLHGEDLGIAQNPGY